MSKTIDVLLSPMVWAMLLIAGVAWRLKKQRRERRVLCAVVVLLWCLSSDAVANSLWRSLELATTSTYDKNATYDAVILLGGLVQDEADEWAGGHSYNDSVERLLSTYDLLRTNHARAVIASGGASYKSAIAVPEARAIEQQLVEWGIERDRVIVEDRSLNTRDNAIESAKIIRERGFKKLLIVTSAFHMKRALGCFRAVDLDVDSLLVDFRTYDPARRSGSLLPRSSNFYISTAAIREMAGWWIYRLRGYVR
ncbi:MAG: YdcF family protein [Polyangiaceae bacterium]